eukprot:CAMPEP_0180213470 /NCGR_PEP_ID=MMETSP0987-20121128/14220_1 /TAXON_ID=697907 /ORGANISM="non described non described, Strain CCMP2293" /LENGTH=254 /DNA_ID=CAMNT_0022171545 /DNA_START=63 /DNA_END=827 /DNA_ORIENTATION=+
MVVHKRSPTIAALSTTCNQLWGADRVLRSVQFLGKIIAESPELSPETRLIWKTLAGAFSRARYINRIYGTVDGVDGLLHDVPRDGPTSVRVAKAIVHGCGELGYHIFENTALFVTLMKTIDPEKIPRMHAWLVKRGLWDRADDLDCYSQWFWFIEACANLFLKLRALRGFAEELRKLDVSSKEGKIRRAYVLREQMSTRIDLIKTLSDLPLAIHFGSMLQGRPGLLLSSRTAGFLGLFGSVANFVVRYRNNRGA